MAKVRALGTTIKFGAALIGGLTSIGEVSPEAEELDATTLDSAGGYREFIQGFKDSGELSLTGYFDKSDVCQTAIRTGFGTGTAAATVITFPSTNGVATFQAWVKAFSLGAADVDGIVGFSATLRITGAVTLT